MIINEGVIIASGTTDELISMGEGGETVYAQIRGLPWRIESELTAMAQVASFKKLDEPEPEIHRYEIKPGYNADNITEDIFRMVVENDWALTELRKVSASLEDVFRHLTTSDSQANVESQE